MMAKPPAIPADLFVRYFALVPCAGVGLRAGVGGPKQYAPVAGQPMVARTLQALDAVERLSAVLVVLAPDDAGFERHVPDTFTKPLWTARCGGATRADTVLAGLRELAQRGADSHDWVLVHDAARCLVRAAWVDRLIDGCAHDAVGGLLALPLADTLKGEGVGVAGGRGAVTIDRAGKWAAQTPQMFRLGLLTEALSIGLGAAAAVEARPSGTGAEPRPVAITDEASAIERLGHTCVLVPGELENFKLTWPSDFALAERLLQNVGAAASCST